MRGCTAWIFLFHFFFNLGNSGALVVVLVYFCIILKGAASLRGVNILFSIYICRHFGLNQYGNDDFVADLFPEIMNFMERHSSFF